MKHWSGLPFVDTGCHTEGVGRQPNLCLRVDKSMVHRFSLSTSRAALAPDGHETD